MWKHEKNWKIEKKLRKKSFPFGKKVSALILILKMDIGFVYYTKTWFWSLTTYKWGHANDASVPLQAAAAQQASSMTIGFMTAAGRAGR